VRCSIVEVVHDVATIDGRRARRERGRLAVVDAMLDLLLEQGAPPPVDELAERAGVSVSSVFRYFDTLDDLQRETTARFFERNAALFEIADIGQGTCAERIERFVRSRVTLHRMVAPIARRSRARSLDHSRLAEAVTDSRHRQFEQVRAQFANELDGRPAAAAIDLAMVIASATSFEAWDVLTTDLDRSDADVARAWVNALTVLLTHHPSTQASTR
jgi:AcrR family transcriptional regulator